MKHMKRTVTALTVAGLLIGALLALRNYASETVQLHVVKPVVIALAFLAQLEFSQMTAKKYPILVWPGVIAGAVYLVSVFYGYDNCLAPIVFALAVTALFSKTDRPIAAFATTVLGIVYIPMMLAYLFWVPLRPGAFDLMWLFYILAIVKISDMGGFAFGVTLGKHKMCPAISPNKSWEGMAGSVFASCLISAAFIPFTHFGVVKALAFGVAAAVTGTLGDLVESRVKRECGVKDSATFMPAGMGGFLDMVDSLVFAPALLHSFL